MKPTLRVMVDTLRDDFADITGRPFEHFFCPILFRDEPAPLCQGHIVNAAFTICARSRTVQRRDVDEFFGARFEGDVVLVHERNDLTAVDALADRRLTWRLHPQVLIGNRVVPHYLPVGTVPAFHSEISVERPDQSSFRLALEIHPEEFVVAGGHAWEARVSRDVRVSTAISLVKAAHLTLFALRGYQYALSPAGRLLGYDILGKLFEHCTGLRGNAIAERAKRHFSQYVNLVRTDIAGAERLDGTVADSTTLVAEDHLGTWAHIVFIRTGQRVHAVLVPTLDSDEHRDRFAGFLDTPPDRLDVRAARFRGGRWRVRRERLVLLWSDGRLTQAAGHLER